MGRWENKKKDGEQRTRGREGQRRVDNQSTESSFHTREFKADGVRACCGGAREKREGGGGEEKKRLSFGSLRLHLTPSIKKGREAWSVHCHKINTDTKSKETEIKRVIDVDREKVKKKTGAEKGGMKKKEQMQRGRERWMQERKGWMSEEGVALHTAGILTLWN